MCSFEKFPYHSLFALLAIQQKLSSKVKFLLPQVTSLKLLEKILIGYSTRMIKNSLIYIGFYCKNCDHNSYFFYMGLQMKITRHCKQHRPTNLDPSNGNIASLRRINSWNLQTHPSHTCSAEMEEWASVERKCWGSTGNLAMLPKCGLSAHKVTERFWKSPVYFIEMDATLVSSDVRLW